MTHAEDQALQRENQYLKQRLAQVEANAAGVAAKVGMTPAEEQALRRENLYLKQRLAQLQDDVNGLSAEGERLRQRLEHVGLRQTRATPNPLGGGQ